MGCDGSFFVISSRFWYFASLALQIGIFAEETKIMSELLFEFEAAGLRMEKSKTHALVYHVYDLAGERLTRSLFEKQFAEPLERLRSQYPAAEAEIRVCAEGDSWINILWPLSSILGHERTFFDVIQLSGNYQNVDLAYPGDTFDEILIKKEYEVALKSASYDYFVFSGGGNDVLGGGALNSFLKDRQDADPREPVETWLNMTNVESAINKLAQGYSTIVNETEVWASGKTTMLMHGYDYPIPRSGEPWLGKPLEDKGYHLITDAVQISSIFKYLVNRFYDMLESIAENPVAHLIDLRNTVGDRWNDELHPKSQASTDIASIFMNEMTPAT
jgi:hypothetical protein